MLAAKINDVVHLDYELCWNCTDAYHKRITLDYEVSLFYGLRVFAEKMCLGS